VDIVLGVSMTPTTVRMVLVEGEKADGVTVDHDVFDISAIAGGATTSASDQVIAAVLGTQESAVAGGHHLKSIGVTWSDHAGAAELRDSLAARGIEDVLLVSELHAAAALAQAVGHAVGYDRTALLFIDRDTATLSVVQTGDGSIVKVLSRSLHSADAMAVLTEMAAAVDAQSSPPQGMFVVGAGVDVTSVKTHLENLVSLPVNAPDEPELALARGAALGSANAPRFEPSTEGLAYSQDPVGSAYPVDLASAATQMASVDGDAVDPDDFSAIPDGRPEAGSKPFLLVGSALTSIFVVGVVALVISLAVSIRPTVDQRPSPGESVIVPSSQAPVPPPAAPVAQPVSPPPPPETIQEPMPVVQQAQQAPREVYVAPAAKPDPPAAIPAPAPAALPPAAPPPDVVPPDAPPVGLPPAPQFPPAWQPPPQQAPPIWRPFWRSPWRQQPQYPQYPQQQQYPQYPQYPQQQQQYPQYPQQQQQYPQYPQQQQYPSQQSPGSGGYGGPEGNGPGGPGGPEGNGPGGPGGPSLCLLPLLGCGH
jgi:hypothetical protein